jgi:hypothetical protein
MKFRYLDTLDCCGDAYAYFARETMTRIPLQGTSWSTAARTQTCTALRLFLRRTRFVHTVSTMRSQCDMRRVLQVTRSDVYLLRANKIAVSVTQRSDPAPSQHVHTSLKFSIQTKYRLDLTRASKGSHPSPRQASFGSISR